VRWRAASLAAAAAASVAAHDALQRRHAILRNFPLVGHARYLLERIGPELRQYIVAGNDDERPFSRDQRRWVYASAKLENNYFGFGTDNDIERTPGYVIVNHRTFGRTAAPTAAHAGEEAWLPCAKVLGAARGRRHAFRPDSVVNISGMSFGALSGNAIEALNRGAALACCLQNTGEGSISPHHRHGGELIYQLGTGYFGSRDERGRFDLARLKDTVASAPVRALEVKLSQGAKPGLGGVLPAAKVSAEIAATRGVPRGVDCISPSRHAAFSDVDSMLDFVEMLADATGLPVGIKSAVGDLSFWRELVRQMAGTGRGVDFVNVDGGEGGTGASPLVFTDTVSMPFRLGFSRVYKIFAEAGLHEDVVFEGGGKLGLPENAVVAFALGADLINVGREAMFAIGCVQAQKCHTDTCPTGVATQNKWLSHGLDPTLKSVRCANYVRTLRRDLLKLAEATGVEHPGLIGSTAVEILTGQSVATPLHEVYGYELAWGFPSPEDRAEIAQLMIRTAPRGDAAPPGVAGSNGATPNGPAPNGLGQVSSTAAAAAPPTRAG
jgi:glutamate synthase domain-containing protein 2